jgi:hypothetical protein
MTTSAIAVDTARLHPPITFGKARTRTSWALSGFAALFLTFDASLKLFNLGGVAEVNAQLGYPASVILPIGILEVVLLALYLVPRTSVLGAVLWTGYLGGAIATHVRVENPLFSHVLFPIYVAIFLWGGLYLRDARVKAMIARRSQD